MDDIKEGQQHEMVVGLGGSSIEGHGNLENKGVRKEAAGTNHRICGRETNIQIFTGAKRI